MCMKSMYRFEPDERIDVLVTVPVEKTDLRPFHSLNYGWELQTANGIQRVPPQVLNYRDDRFNWQQLTEEGITALWTSEGPFFGEQVVAIAAAALRAGSTLLPLAQIEPIDIYVYPRRRMCARPWNWWAQQRMRQCCPARGCCCWQW